MSADKNRAEYRAMVFLERILADGRTGVFLHCIGGCSRNDSSLQWLVAKGYMHIPLNRGTPPKWSREFTRFFTPFGIHGRAPRQYAEVTEAGRKAYQDYPKPAPTYQTSRRLQSWSGNNPDYRFVENLALLY